MTTIIAEAGINHNGNMSTMKELILRAKECGADIFKTQAYSVELLFPDHVIQAQGKNWYNEVLKTELTKEQLFQIASWCKEVEIEFMASAFDSDRVRWLEEIGVAKHKIGCRLYHSDLDEADGEIGETVEAMCLTGKPIIVSCPYGEDRPFLPTEAPVYYLYCVPEYPAPLSSLKFSQVTFDGHIWDGFSDHTQGLEASMIAISRGASIIEKHFSLDKNDKRGPDHICSCEPKELKQLVEFAKKVEEAL